MRKFQNIIFIVSAAITILLSSGCPKPTQEKPKKESVKKPPVPPAPKETPEALFTKQVRNAKEPIPTEELYKAYCGACHTLDLVESQRLDRAGWDWVLDDMINEYGGTWITDTERTELVNYLAQEFGTSVP